MAHYEYFPPELLNLQDEVLKHPPLVMLFSNLDPQDIGEALAHVAHYLGIPVDATMSIRECLDFADLLTRKLYESRTGLVITTLH